MKCSSTLMFLFSQCNAISLHDKIILHENKCYYVYENITYVNFHEHLNDES